jgi:hypothetical protein
MAQKKKGKTKEEVSLIRIRGILSENGRVGKCILNPATRGRRGYEARAIRYGLVYVRLSIAKSNAQCGHKTALRGAVFDA